MNQHTSPNPNRQTGISPSSLHLGMPHPTIPNIYFLKYRYGRATPEQWGTLDQLDNKRKKEKAGHQKRAKKPGYKEKKNKTAKIWRKANPEKIKKYQKEGHQKRVANGKHHEYRNRPEIKKRDSENRKNWRLNNPEKTKAARQKCYQKRVSNGKNEEYRKQPEVKILDSLRSAVRRVIKNPTGDYTFKTLDLIGCSPKKLLKHLEKQFYDNPQTGEKMSWDNYGMFGWHIDHIIPCASFNHLRIKDRKKCFNYTNLQPLWCHENWSKKDNLNWQKAA